MDTRRRDRRSLTLLAALFVTTLGVSSQPANCEEASELRLVVEKESRRLTVYRGDRAVDTFAIGLGFMPEGQKIRQGDGATPEGEYFVCIKNPKSQYYLSLGLNYPNARDAARGLEQKLINRSQHDAIVRAEEREVCPSWSTRLGGEIFIHGRGSSSDWTLGCIALDDVNMRKLYDTVEVGTPVEIKP